MFYRIAQFVTRLGLSFWYKIIFVNKPQIPRGKGLIVASNHVHATDPMLVSYGLGRQIHYMAKKEIFSNWFFTLVLKGINVFAVERGAGDGSALDYASSLIRDGKIMGIFPEGTRSKDGNLLRAKSGMAMVAYGTHSDILPAALYYECFGRFRSKVYVSYGEVLTFEKLGFAEGKPNEIKIASRAVMEEIANLITDCKDRCGGGGERV